jgi:hypothetical protein
MLAIVFVMLASNTAAVFLTLEIYIVQLPGMGESSIQPDILRKLVAYDIGENWLLRLNVCLF